MGFEAAGEFTLYKKNPLDDPIPMSAAKLLRLSVVERNGFAVGGGGIA